jgi:hypothetical protein
VKLNPFDFNILPIKAATIHLPILLIPLLVTKCKKQLKNNKNYSFKATNLTNLLDLAFNTTRVIILYTASLFP